MHTYIHTCMHAGINHSICIYVRICYMITDYQNAMLMNACRAHHSQIPRLLCSLPQWGDPSSTVSPLVLNVFLSGFINLYKRLMCKMHALLMACMHVVLTRFFLKYFLWIIYSLTLVLVFLVLYPVIFSFWIHNICKWLLQNDYYKLTVYYSGRELIFVLFCKLFLQKGCHIFIMYCIKSMGQSCRKVTYVYNYACNYENSTVALHQTVLHLWHVML